MLRTIILGNTFPIKMTANWKSEIRSNCSQPRIINQEALSSYQPNVASSSRTNKVYHTDALVESHLSFSGFESEIIPWRKQDRNFNALRKSFSLATFSGVRFRSPAPKCQHTSSYGLRSRQSREKEFSVKFLQNISIFRTIEVFTPYFHCHKLKRTLKLSALCMSPEQNAGATHESAKFEK